MWYYEGRIRIEPDWNVKYGVALELRLEIVLE